MKKFVLNVVVVSSGEVETSSIESPPMMVGFVGNVLWRFSVGDFHR